MRNVRVCTCPFAFIAALAAVFVVVVIAPPVLVAQSADPALMAEINQIKAIDNHSHPPKLVGIGEKDDDFDALPCDPLEPTAPNFMGRADNPRIVAAWKALYGYRHDDMTPAHVRELVEAKDRVKQREGDGYANWVLEHIGIESELANRVALGRGLEPPHFYWVPFDDALLAPLNNSLFAAETPDRKFFYGREEMLLKRYMKDLNVAAAPATLEQYLSQVVTPTLERQKKAGAVAIKFEAAYLRTLDFEPADHDDAAQVYSKFAGGGVPPKADYLRLEDYIFRTIAREAGRLGLAVHIHTGVGCGGYFRMRDADPALLESVLDDVTLRKTNFVLLHGGAGPFTKEVAFLLMKPNVYTDYSEQTWLLSTRRLSEVVRDFLEWYPEKTLFGTDLFPGAAELDWEEVGWMTSRNAREALAIALTGMMNDGEITHARALELARMVLRGNAEKLYGWEEKK
jgi:predicted TIM-barrel fold metal-dependent hydrolase